MLNEGPEKLLLDEPAGVTQEEELVTLDEFKSLYKKKREFLLWGYFSILYHLLLRVQHHHVQLTLTC